MPTIFVPKESHPGETRVAATPETVKALVKEGFAVEIEAGAGVSAHFLDAAYTEAGATLVSDLRAAFGKADLVLKVGPLTDNPRLPGDEAAALRAGAIVIAMLAPHKNLPMVRTLRDRNVTALALELVPRITRAQKMDVLSSQANIAGYKAVLLAAAKLGKYMPLLMTAAGTIQPAKVVIMGAGVAGLQAIATARKLGAVVWVTDVRPAVKEQVESLGGKFIDLPMQESGEGAGGYAREMSAEFLARQQAVIAEHVASADVVITTAQIPGKPAPRLITAATVQRMRPGSIIVDLAAEQGGNCELTEPGQDVVQHGVLIVGATNLPATTPIDASTVFARNVLALVLHLGRAHQKKGEKGPPELKIDLDEEVTRGTTLVHAGQVVHAPTAQALGA